MDVTIADLLEIPEARSMMMVMEAIDKGLEEFIEERRRKGRPVPEDIIKALSQIKTGEKGHMSKEDWGVLCETISRVTGGK